MYLPSVAFSEPINKRCKHHKTSIDPYTTVPLCCNKQAAYGRMTTERLHTSQSIDTPQKHQKLSTVYSVNQQRVPHDILSQQSKHNRQSSVTPRLHPDTTAIQVSLPNRQHGTQRLYQTIVADWSCLCQHTDTTLSLLHLVSNDHGVGAGYRAHPANPTNKTSTEGQTLVGEIVIESASQGPLLTFCFLTPLSPYCPAELPHSLMNM